MSKYTNTSFINLDIIVDGEHGNVKVYSLYINNIMSIPNNGIQWEHVYDLSTKYHTCDDMDALCNMIGDFFHGVKIANSTNDNTILFFIKFINMFVIPFVRDNKYIKEYLSSVDVTFLCHTTNRSTLPSKFDKYTTGMHKSYGESQMKRKIDTDIPIFGDLRDIELFYQLVICGAYYEVIKPKWFRSIACIISYLDLNNIIELVICKSCETDEGFDLTNADAEITFTIETAAKNKINYRFDTSVMQSTMIALKMMRYAIEYRSDIVFSEMTTVISNVKKFIDQHI